jgi:hypothetical protein
VGVRDEESTVLLRDAPPIAGLGVAELLLLVRDRKLRYARIDGEIHLYLKELHALKQPA